MDSNFKVSIYQEPAFGSLSILLWGQRPNGKRYVIKPIKFECKEIESENFDYEPTMRISPDLAPAWFQAWAEAMDTHGVKTDSDAKIAGILEATREHLKDLQKLVFKERK